MTSFCIVAADFELNYTLVLSVLLLVCFRRPSGVFTFSELRLGFFACSPDLEVRSTRLCKKTIKVNWMFLFFIFLNLEKTGCYSSKF